MRASIDKINKLLNSKKTITITTHTNPDGDAIGSSFALYHYLLKLNHNVKVITPNKHPDFLDWVPGIDNLEIFDENPEKCNKILDTSDLVFMLDYNDLKRASKLGLAISQFKGTTIMIDHHQNPVGYSDIEFSEPNITSTSEMIYMFIKMCGKIEKIDRDIATCIYLGMMTDTGSFQYKGVSSTTHDIISSLLTYGVDNNKIYNNVYNSNEISKLKLLSVALKNLELIIDKKTALMHICQKDLIKNNYKKGDSEGIVNYGLTLSGIQFSVIFIEDENEKNKFKISFRSKEDFPCNEFASNFFDGGGHLNAAGGIFKGNLNSAIEYFKKSLNEF
jgi:phosphoesterase RecJ-like protein